MNNQMLYILGGLVALVVVLLAVFMPTMETSTEPGDRVQGAYRTDSISKKDVADEKDVLRAVTSKWSVMNPVSNSYTAAPHDEKLLAKGKKIALPMDIPRIDGKVSAAVSAQGGFKKII